MLNILSRRALPAGRLARLVPRQAQDALSVSKGGATPDFHHGLITVVMMTTRRFSPRIVAAVDESTIIGIRAGARTDHRFIGIWAVVVDGRVFARSWTRTPAGWYRTFLEDPLGTIQVGEREIRIRVRPARGERLRDAVERAYAAKYSTPGAVKYVRGFRAPRRRETTVELLPR